MDAGSKGNAEPASTRIIGYNDRILSEDFGPKKRAAADVTPAAALEKAVGYFTKCSETSLVSSNMLTDFLPLSTGFNLSSALI